jgi:hypothetical protein
MAISAEDQIIHYLKEKVGLTKADELVGTLKREIAESLHQFADQEDGQLTTTSASAYVQGVRDAANRIIEK